MAHNQKLASLLKNIEGKEITEMTNDDLITIIKTQTSAIDQLYEQIVKLTEMTNIHNYHLARLDQDRRIENMKVFSNNKNS